MPADDRAITSSNSTAASANVLAWITPHGVGRLHLNNPKALNALNLDGVRVMNRALRDWRDDAAITEVLVTGEGTRAFCAGGDVKSLQQMGPIAAADKGLPGLLHADFFREEYELNALIAAYPKPYASLWDGVVMGGGVGVSIMGSHRIATETVRFGMPETAIGFFPDVGGGYFLSRAGAIGRYLALTSLPIAAALTAAAGFTTQNIAADDRGAFVAGVEALGLRAALDVHAQAAPDMSAEDAAALACVERCFGAEQADVPAVISRLLEDGSAFASKAKAAIEKRSPLALAVTDEQLRRSKSLDFNACLEMEFDMSQEHMVDSDFFEGVRSVLVDKDHSPRWQFESLADLDQGNLDRFFAKIGRNGLNLAVC